MGNGQWPLLFLTLKLVCTGVCSAVKECVPLLQSSVAIGPMVIFTSGLIVTLVVRRFNKLIGRYVSSFGRGYTTLLKMVRYCSTTVCYYWDMSVK